MIEIRVRVSVVLLVRDGFTGLPITKSTVRVLLNGQPAKPEYRAGGYLVFVNLAPGAHEIILSGVYTLSETLLVDVPASGYDERIVYLKPAQNYPFGGKIARLRVLLRKNGKPVAGGRVLVAARPVLETKIAQDAAAKGETRMKLYVRGDNAMLRLPSTFLILDAKQSEVCTLTAIAGDTGVLAQALAFDHKRGTALCPCQTYLTDEDGVFTACFREPTDIHLFVEADKLLQAVTLAAGSQEITIEV